MSPTTFRGLKNVRSVSWAVVIGVVLLALPSALSAGPIEVAPKEKCPVCGMFVAKYPGWAARIEFTDSTSVVFDGVKDMFKYYFDMGRYDGAKRSRDDISTIRVTDYYSVEAIDGKAAWYVGGSDVYGPMGNELIPFVTEDDAVEFHKDHRGKDIYRFEDITPGIIGDID